MSFLRRPSRWRSGWGGFLADYLECFDIGFPVVKDCGTELYPRVCFQTGMASTNANDNATGQLMLTQPPSESKAPGEATSLGYELAGTLNRFGSSLPCSDQLVIIADRLALDGRSEPAFGSLDSTYQADPNDDQPPESGPELSAFGSGQGEVGGYLASHGRRSTLEEI